ncbi:MAG: hypothetical protein FWE84_04400 [Firmicutes bacterium]|nr:hypothetical protein [Bacillota bacterium]
MAIINIGSGSVKLYLQKTGQTRTAVTLLALDNNEKATSETFGAVAAFCLKAVNAGEKVTIFGTEAMRRDNTLADLILDKLGLAADIIDGKTEALCGFLGCGGEEFKTVIDVGGASSEISSGSITHDLADNQKAKGEFSSEKFILDFSVSLKIGSVALYNIFGKDEKNLDLSHIFDYIDAVLDFSSPQCKGKVYAIGGTALYLAGIVNTMKNDVKADNEKTAKFVPKTLSGTKISADEILTALKTLFAMDVKQRVAAYPFIEEKRALVLPYGISALYRILNKLSFSNQVHISTAGLIEGYIKLRNL